MKSITMKRCDNIWVFDEKNLSEDDLKNRDWVMSLINMNGSSLNVSYIKQNEKNVNMCFDSFVCKTKNYESNDVLVNVRTSERYEFTFSNDNFEKFKTICVHNNCEIRISRLVLHKDFRFIMTSNSDGIYVVYVVHANK